jgi:mRNA-degrading endonuclease YafQ of YafQ-DinJ toxin-antitoxin module
MEMNPFHPSLRLHPLHGKLKGLYSISVTVSYRITVEFVIDEKEILLIHIGAHDEVSNRPLAKFYSTKNSSRSNDMA